MSNDTYSTGISYSNSDLVVNPAVLTAAGVEFFQNSDGGIFSPGAVNTYYQLLDIAAFDTGNIGVKGIELSNMGAQYPDITYIGVTEAVPEPSTYALLALSAAGLAGHVLLRCRK